MLLGAQLQTHGLKALTKWQPLAQEVAVAFSARRHCGSTDMWCHIPCMKHTIQETNSVTRLYCTLDEYSYPQEGAT